MAANIERMQQLISESGVIQVEALHPDVKHASQRAVKADRTQARFHHDTKGIVPQHTTHVANLHKAAAAKAAEHGHTDLANKHKERETAHRDGVKAGPGPMPPHVPKPPSNEPSTTAATAAHPKA